MVLFDNNTLEIFNLDNENHHKNILSLPEFTNFVIHDDINERLIVIHQNKISYFSLEGKFLDFTNFQALNDFVAYQKIGHLLFLGIILLI